MNKKLKIIYKMIYPLIIFVVFNNLQIFAKNKYDITQFFKETSDFVVQPAKWEGMDYLKLGLIGLGTWGTMHVDESIRSNVLKNTDFQKTVPMVFGRMYGELYSPVLLFSGFALHSLLTDNDWSRKVAFEIGQACIYAGGINYMMKIAIGRARPYMEEGVWSYHPSSSLFVEDNHSFPSGHTTAAFVLSTVLARNVKPFWLKTLMYLPSVLTVSSRIYQDKHWTSDCLAGAAMGYFIATWVVDKHEKTDTINVSDQSLMQRMQIQPFVDNNIYGVNFRIDFK